MPKTGLPKQSLPKTCVKIVTQRPSDSCNKLDARVNQFELSVISSRKRLLTENTSAIRPSVPVIPSLPVWPALSRVSSRHLHLDLLPIPLEYRPLEISITEAIPPRARPRPNALDRVRTLQILPIPDHLIILCGPRSISRRICLLPLLWKVPMKETNLIDLQIRRKTF